MRLQLSIVISNPSEEGKSAEELVTFTMKKDTASLETQMTGKMFPSDMRFLIELEALIDKYKDRYAVPKDQRGVYFRREEPTP